MKTEQHKFLVKSNKPPTVEVDHQSESVYVRFKKAAVAKTIPIECKTMHLAVDLDAKGEVIGIEAVGVREFSLQAILEKAAGSVPPMDFSRTYYVPTDLVAA
jgi:uncharacterized protein YuzE